MPFQTYTASQIATGGSEPWGICYDNNGHVWSCDTVAGTILKINVATQAVIDTIAIPGGDARGCCYDAGTNTVWAVSNGGHTVTKINAATDAIIGTYAIGSGGTGLTSDGTRIWICNQNDNTVTVRLATDGSLVATVSVGNGPNDIAFDGTHLWTANQSGNSITKITASSHTVVGTYAVGNQPIGIASDGTDIWVTDGGHTPTFLQSLERITVATGAVANTYALGDDGTLDSFAGMTWDSSTGILWMCNARGGPGNNFVYAVDVSNGTIAATYNGYAGGAPFLVCVAGTTIWASNNNAGFLTELIPNAAPPAGCMVAWLAINEPGDVVSPTGGWTPRESVGGLRTFDSRGTTAGQYAAHLTWPPACNGVNQATMIALSSVNPVTLVQAATVSNTGTFSTFNLAFASANSAGGTLVIDIYFFASSATAGPVTVTDSRGNTWIEAVGAHPPFQGYFLQTWYVPSCAAGANTVTVAIGGSFPFRDLQLAVHEYSGVAAVLEGATYGCGPLFGTGSPIDISLIATSQVLLHLATSSAQNCAGATVSGGGTLPNVWTDQSTRLHVSESITFSWLVRQRGTAQIPLILSSGDDYMPTIGSQVCLWDITEADDFEVFSGTIDDLEIKWLGQNGDRIVMMTCVSLEQVFDTIRLPNLLFTGQTAGAIFAAVYAYATGCPVALGTVDAGATIDSFNTPDFPSISDVFTRLATESQYVWGVDPGTGTVYFTPPNLTPSPFTVNATDVLWEQFTLKEERHDYRNRQSLKVNSNAAILSKELFSGSAQSSFTMLRPVSQITNAWLTQNVQNHATGTFTGQPAVGDTISFQTPSSGSTYNWSAGGTYAVGAIIIDSNGFIQKVTTSVGVTGGSEPAWIEIYGHITQDNLVQWQNQGQSGFSNGDLADYTFVDSLDGYYGAAGVWPITADNPTGKMPANAQFGQVLIGATLAATIQNLADAINAIQTLAGVTFSLPTWENPVVNADTPAGATTIIVRNKAAEASYITALSESCATFSWSSALTTGGLTTFGTVVITFGVAGQTTGGSVFTIVYTQGSNIIESATPLQPGNYLQIEYAAVNSGYIQVENTADVLARAAIEGGTGKYQQTSSDDSALSMPVGLQLVQQQLAAFGIIPQTFEFTTMRAGLYVGQVLAILMLSPDNAPTLINGNWFIQEIKAEVVPVYGPTGESNRWLPNGGHFRYTVTCIDVAQIGSWLDFWLGLSTGGGGGGGGTAVFSGGGALGPVSTGDTFGGVNEQTVSYTALSTDNGRIISMHHATLARTLTLPATPPSTTWCICVQNTGAATVTVHPNGLQLDGVIADVTLKTGTGLYISTDGINYFTERGLQPGVPASVYTVAFAAVSSVTVTHNLGTTAVIAAVYDSTVGAHPVMVIPSTLEITSANVVTVTFGVATSGYIVVIGG